MKLASRTYTLSIEKHPDGYLAFFPALEGCNTWGQTYEEAVANAEEALALYLETLDQLIEKDFVPDAELALDLARANEEVRRGDGVPQGEVFGRHNL